MLYPFDPKGTCSTQPLIDIRNITLVDIKITDSLLFPILLRCNKTNNCSGIYFKNVTANKWFIGNKNKGYVCENVQGIQEGGYPKLDCLNEGENRQESMNLKEESMNLREENVLTRKTILESMERAVRQVGYIEEDD